MLIPDDFYAQSRIRFSFYVKLFRYFTHIVFISSLKIFKEVLLHSIVYTRRQCCWSFTYNNHIFINIQIGDLVILRFLWLKITLGIHCGTNAVFEYTPVHFLHYIHKVKTHDFASYNNQCFKSNISISSGSTLDGLTFK